MHIQRTLFGKALAVAALALAAIGTAQARDNVYWSVGVQAAPGVNVGVGNHRPVTVYQQPVYVQPTPQAVYQSSYVVPPPQVVYQQSQIVPQVIYTQPRVVYPGPIYYQQPAPVYYVGGGHRHYRHHDRHHDRHDRHEWRGHRGDDDRGHGRGRHRD